MIDPSNITNYNLSDDELEEHLLFWVCAAGKTATTAARSLDNLLEGLKKFLSYKFSPFELVHKTDKYSGDLSDRLKTSGIGCYRAKTRTMLELSRSGLNLRECSVEDLEKIYGIGPKTARCFILHSRKNARLAGLDTHILKFLRSKGHDVPKSTPNNGKLYKSLEQLVLMYADKSGMTPADFDLTVWRYYARS